MLLSLLRFLWVRIHSFKSVSEKIRIVLYKLKSMRVKKNYKKQVAELADGLAAFLGVPFIWYTEAGDGSRHMLTIQC